MTANAILVALVIQFVLGLAALLMVLHRVDKFMVRAMVFMKSNTIHDVVSARSVLRDEKIPEEEEPEVVMDDAEEDELLIKTQKTHRNKHFAGLGSEHA